MTAHDDRARDEQPAPAEPFEELPNARVRFWVCKQHRRGRVEWRGDVAHCLEGGCGRTSEQPAPAGDDELAEAEGKIRYTAETGMLKMGYRAALRLVLAEYDERGRELERLRATARAVVDSPDLAHGDDVVANLRAVLDEDGGQEALYILGEDA